MNWPQCDLTSHYGHFLLAAAFLHPLSAPFRPGDGYMANAWHRPGVISVCHDPTRTQAARHCPKTRSTFQQILALNQSAREMLKPKNILTAAPDVDSKNKNSWCCGNRFTIRLSGYVYRSKPRKRYFRLASRIRKWVFARPRQSKAPREKLLSWPASSKYGFCLLALPLFGGAEIHLPRAQQKTCNCQGLNYD